MVVINFILEPKNGNGDYPRTVEKIISFSSSVSGYVKYKDNFLKIFDSLIKKIDSNYNRIDLSLEVLDDRLSKIGKLLFRSSYRTIEDLRIKLTKVTDKNFSSRLGIWRRNLKREFKLKNNYF
jgi:hypothetical protein